MTMKGLPSTYNKDLQVDEFLYFQILISVYTRLYHVKAHQKQNGELSDI